MGSNWVQHESGLAIRGTEHMGGRPKIVSLSVWWTGIDEYFTQHGQAWRSLGICTSFAYTADQN